jgi:hypothetical protein
MEGWGVVRVGRRSSAAGAEAYWEGEGGEGRCEGCRSDLSGAHGGEEAVEFFAVESAEFHVAFNYAVEVDFLGFEVV